MMEIRTRLDVAYNQILTASVQAGTELFNIEDDHWGSLHSMCDELPEIIEEIDNKLTLPHNG
jgi:hypothetical protein